ncbi:hypothetical protein R6Q59_003728 [Mikania micrantha]
MVHFCDGKGLLWVGSRGLHAAVASSLIERKDGHICWCCLFVVLLSSCGIMCLALDLQCRHNLDWNNPYAAWDDLAASSIRLGAALLRPSAAALWPGAALMLPAVACVRLPMVLGWPALAIGAPKKVRSHTQKAEIWKMVSNERILVMFNKFGKPVGDEGKELVQYIGTLVRMPEHVSIEHSDWRKVPMQQKEDMYSLVKNTCAKKRFSRSKMKEPHVTGTKSFARLAHEVAIKNDGVYPTRGEMYIKTRTRKDGSVVDDEAASVVASLKAIASDSISTPGDRDDFTRDDYSKVKGPEKGGYVRLVGRIPATKDKGDSEINSQTIHQLQSVVNVMMNIIYEHIPNANLSTVLKDMNIQVPCIGSSTLNNCLFGNQLSSSRSHDDEDIVDKL